MFKTSETPEVRYARKQVETSVRTMIDDIVCRRATIQVSGQPNVGEWTFEIKGPAYPSGMGVRLRGESAGLFIVTSIELSAGQTIINSWQAGMRNFFRLRHVLLRAITDHQECEAEDERLNKEEALIAFAKKTTQAK